MEGDFGEVEKINQGGIFGREGFLGERGFGREGFLGGGFLSEGFSARIFQRGFFRADVLREDCVGFNIPYQKKAIRLPVVRNSSRDEYGSEGVVDDYANRSELQRPEAAILDEFRTQIASGSMLDIGVGGGRTTMHFGPVAQKYIGLDYAAQMVKACQSRFGDKYEFACGDVRKMARFEDESFDFTLFSYNGLDYIEHSDRLVALQEIRRVQNENAVFCFSTHNIQCVDRLFGLRHQLSLDPRELLDRMSTWGKLRMRYSPSRIARIRSSEHSYFFDGFRDTYYIRPDAQIRQLEQAGFKGIRVFSIDSGLELSLAALATATDYWLYYVAEKA